MLLANTGAYWTQFWSLTFIDKTAIVLQLNV